MVPPQCCAASDSYRVAADNTRSLHRSQSVLLFTSAYDLRMLCIYRTIKGMWTDNTRNAKIKGGSNIEWL